MLREPVEGEGNEGQASAPTSLVVPRSPTNASPPAAAPPQALSRTPWKVSAPCRHRDNPNPAQFRTQVMRGLAELHAGRVLPWLALFAHGVPSGAHAARGVWGCRGEVWARVTARGSLSPPAAPPPRGSTRRRRGGVSWCCAYEGAPRGSCAPRAQVAPLLPPARDPARVGAWPARRARRGLLQRRQPRPQGARVLALREQRVSAQPEAVGRDGGGSRGAGQPGPAGGRADLLHLPCGTAARDEETCEASDRDVRGGAACPAKTAPLTREAPRG